MIQEHKIQTLLQQTYLWPLHLTTTTFNQHSVCGIKMFKYLHAFFQSGSSLVNEEFFYWCRAQSLGVRALGVGYVSSQSTQPINMFYFILLSLNYFHGSRGGLFLNLVCFGSLVDHGRVFVKKWVRRRKILNFWYPQEGQNYVRAVGQF